MKNKLVLIMAALGTMTLFTACGDDHHCGTNIEGCPSDYYSCPEASRCYSNEAGCASSGECDD